MYVLTGAGNVRSVRNAIKKLGFNVKEVGLSAFELHTGVPIWSSVFSSTFWCACLLSVQVDNAGDIAAAQRLIFPGVGAFGQAMDILEKRGYTQALKDYILADKPFLGICLGLQLLFDGSEESGGCEGLGLVPGTVAHFDISLGLPVPHIGWNNLQQQ